MLANLAQSLFEHGSITTTVTKAKRLRPFAERLVTFAKRGDLASRRRVLGIISDKGVVHHLFADIAPVFKDRNGGYTRITKVGVRKGDNAPMAVIELVDGPVSAKQAVVAEATKAVDKAADASEAKKDEGEKKAPAKKAPAKKAPAKKPAAKKDEGEKKAPAKKAPAKKAPAKKPAAKKDDAK